MTDAIKELFQMLTQKERSGSDYTGTVTSVSGKTAYVQFDGSEITDTPVSMSIGAKQGDAVRVRVADGRAWLIGNDTAPPNDSSEVANSLSQTNMNLNNTTLKIDTLSARYAEFNKVVTNELIAHQAVIDNLDATYANIDFANINTAEINLAKVKDLFTQVGLIQNAVIDQGKITGYLDAVEVNCANITAGTLIADRICIRGTSDSIVYALNNYGQISSQQVNTLDGYILTDRTVNADKIVAHSITATEITTQNIVGTNGWINLSAGTFAFGVNKLTWNGTAMNVAGWMISENYLSNSVGNDKYIYLGNGTNNIGDVLVVRTGTSSSNYEYPFYVRADGTFHAGKGTIGGWTIGADGFYSSNNTIWMVRTNGGSIHFESGSGLNTKYSEMQPGSMGISHGNSQFSVNHVNGYGVTYETDAGNRGFSVKITGQVAVSMLVDSSRQNHGLYSNGYYNSSTYTFTSDPKWILSRHSNGMVYTINAAGYERPVMTSADNNAQHVAALACNSATQLGIHGEWGVAGTYAYMYVSVSSSDPRLKYDIEPVTAEALPIIDSLPMYSFSWLVDNRHWDIGFIATELYDIDPNLCLVPEDEKEGYWGIDSFYLVGLLTKAVKELSSKVRALERRSA